MLSEFNRNSIKQQQKFHGLPDMRRVTNYNLAQLRLLVQVRPNL